MNRINVTSALVLLSLSLFGCAAQPTYRLAAQEQAGVKVITGNESGSSVVTSDREGSMIVLTPKEEKGLKNTSELWFNLVAINKKGAPVDFSLSNVSATVNGQPAKIPDAVELERLLKSANMKARALAWGTFLLSAASIGANGGDASAFTAKMLPAYMKAESMGSETTAKMLDQYKDTVLKPDSIAPLENHGGQIRVIPAAPIAGFTAIDLRFDVGSDSHLVQFVVQTEAEKK